MNMIHSETRVTLAGAGPGDPELITLKLQQRLQSADVIITDRLVHPDIITQHARKDVQIFNAGKQGYNEQSYTQEEVTALLIEEAQKGKRVLRLKGGDVAFFSNVLDELEALTKNKVPFEIIPGITAASGASAFTGIPLTARGYAQGVRFMAYNPNQQYDNSVWRSLAETSDTLIVYMAGKTIHSFVKQLLLNGAPKERPLAIIEQATTVNQKIHITKLVNTDVDFGDILFSSPSLVMIGDVLLLHGRFSWFKGGYSGSVFNEITD